MKQVSIMANKSAIKGSSVAGYGTKGQALGLQAFGTPPLLGEKENAGQQGIAMTGHHMSGHSMSGAHMPAASMAISSSVKLSHA